MRHDIGHTYIDSDVGLFEFYPTFKNIRSICEPEELPSVFANVNGVIKHKAEISEIAGLSSMANIYRRSLYQLCALIMQSCCDKDITPLVGRIKWERSPKHFQLGVMPLDHMVAFCKILLKHGVIGIHQGKSESGDKCDKIDVYDFVNIAMAHLDMSKYQAESLTKTEFDKLMIVKFPESNKPTNGAPTDEEYHNTMAFLDKVNAKRNNNG